MLNELENLLRQVEKPGRYAGNEFNVVRKERERVATTVVLAYPDLYEIGMSYYGFQILYHILNREADLAAERVYAPADDFARLLRARQLPLTSLESHTPLRNFDIVGFTLPYELTYTNILEMLDLAGITLLAEKREKDEPFIIGGGSGAFNPEPLAPFFDLFVIGDAEDIVVPLVKYIATKRRKNLSRWEILKALVQEFPGIYVPAFYQPDENHLPVPVYSWAPPKIQSQKVLYLKPENYPTKPLMPLIAITHDRLVVELMRGCTEGCRFCQAGMLYRPIRERPVAEVLQQIEKGIPATGYDEVSLLSLSTSDYSAINPLLRHLKTDLQRKNIALSYPSLRLDSFGKLLAQVGRETHKSGLTFAPEAGSARLRRVINKQITAENLLQAVSMAQSYGWRLVKLYFMIGLPTETDDDLFAIRDLCQQVLNAGQKRISLNITLATFIPKPFTPFQWEKMTTIDEIQRRLDLLKPLLRQLKNIKAMGREPQSSVLEAVITRGDRRLAAVIHNAWQKGAHCDAWKENFRSEVWKAAFASQSLELEEFLQARPVDKPLPWEVIDCGVDRTFLLEERTKAFAEIVTPDCRNGCQVCGVCFPDGPQMLFAEDISFAISEKESLVNIPPQPMRYLLHYRKYDAAVFTSHLDTLRIFQQSLRRAGLEPVITQGFNPHPKISAGHPLPIGFAGDDELLEVTLNQPHDDIVARLNRVLPSGFKIVAAEILAPQTPAVFSRVIGFSYAIEFITLPADLPAKIAALNMSKELLIERTSANKKVTLDLNSFISRLEIDGNRLLIDLRVIDGRTIKINEIMRALDLSDVNYRVVRLHSRLTP